jgi:hypothetical protein
MTVLPDRQMYSDGELARAAAGDRRPHGRQTVAGLGAEGEPEAATGVPHPADHELGPGLELPPPPWYRRPGILSAAALAALIAIVGVSVSVPGEPGTAPDGTTGTSTRWSASGTPSGGTPTGGARTGGTPTGCSASVGTRTGATPSGSTAASSAFGAGVEG